MPLAIMQAVIEASKAAIIAVGEADNPGNNVRLVHAPPISGTPQLKQPIFNWKATNTKKYEFLK